MTWQPRWLLGCGSNNSLSSYLKVRGRKGGRSRTEQLGEDVISNTEEGGETKPRAWARIDNVFWVNLEEKSFKDSEALFFLNHRLSLFSTSVILASLLFKCCTLAT